MRVYLMIEEEKLILLHFILLCQRNMRISHIPRNESEKLMKSQIRIQYFLKIASSYITNGAVSSNRSYVKELTLKIE
jgi:hypothetical protein